MIHDLLEELTTILETRLVSTSAGSGIKLLDLSEAVRELRQYEEQNLPRLIQGAKISRADAAKRLAIVKRAHKIIALIGSDALRAIEVMKQELAEASKRPQKIYIPATVEMPKPTSGIGQTD